MSLAAGAAAAAAQDAPPAGAVEELRSNLAHKEEQVQKLKSVIVQYKEMQANLPALLQKQKKTAAALQEERATRQMLEAALEQHRADAAAAHQAAVEARREAHEAKAQASAALKAADAARSDAAAVHRELGALAAQLQRLQAQSQGLPRQAAVPAGPDDEPPASAAEVAALQAAVAQVEEQMVAEAEQTRRFSCAMAILGGADPVRAAQQLAALPSIALPATAPAPAGRHGKAAAAAGATSPRQQQRAKQQRGPRQQAAHEQPAAAAAAAAQQQQQQQARAVAAAPPEKPAEVRARAVAARGAANEAAKATGGARPGKRQAAEAFGAAPANANIFGEVDRALRGGGQPAKRARQPAAAAGAAGVSLPRAGRPVAAQQPARGAADGSGAGVAAAEEASLAISGNDVEMGQAREHMTVADDVAQQLGCITSAALGSGATQQSVHDVAAKLQVGLSVDRHIPLGLLVRGFETAVLECAAPKPHAHALLLEPAAGEDAAAAAAQASPDGWFEPVSGQQQHAQPGAPPYAAVWCSRAALAGHLLQLLLYCACRLQRLDEQLAAAKAAAAGQPAPAQRGSFVAALRRHLHRRVVQCCVAGGSIVRHTETEACVLAAAAAGLCRASGNVEAFWALLLDLLACPAAPAAVLPPMAAALDVWPSAVQPAGGSGGSGVAGFHAALQHLCSLAAAGDPAAQTAAVDTSAPLLLVLEGQPVAAAAFLRRQGQQHWGWAAGAAGSSTALEAVRAALERTAAPGPPAVAAPAAPPAAPAALPADIVAAHGAFASLMIQQSPDVLVEEI